VVQRLANAAGPRSVLLTFDDGPCPIVTPGVLDRLAAFEARAVFFVIGKRIRRAPQLLDRIRAGGHLIGNHSLLHRDGYIHARAIGPSLPAYLRDCRRCQAVIERRAGVRPTIFRPPGGRLTATTMIVPKLVGLTCMTWSQDVKDWTFRSEDDAHAGAARLIQSLRPRDIVLLHDDNPWVLTLLDDLLPALRSRGFDLQAGVASLSSPRSTDPLE
jgi:peptidoglycan/xylan/chitin deacetylase (PgdA/CDA1 family)